MSDYTLSDTVNAREMAFDFKKTSNVISKAFRVFLVNEGSHLHRGINDNDR